MTKKFFHGLSLPVVAILLTLIHKCPWGVDNLLAIQRILIVGLSSSLSAAVSDAIKESAWSCRSPS